MTIACDVDTNDIAFTDGVNIAFIDGSDACAQNLRQKSLMRLGEDQYDTQDGIDYFGTVFTPQPNFDAARQSLVANLLRCPDVISIKQLDINVIADVFFYRAQIVTVYGPVNIEQQAGV